MTDIEIINRLNDISYFLQSRKDITYTKKDHEALCRAKEAIENASNTNCDECVYKSYFVEKLDNGEHI